LPETERSFVGSLGPSPRCSVLKQLSLRKHSSLDNAPRAGSEGMSVAPQGFGTSDPRWDGLIALS